MAWYGVRMCIEKDVGLYEWRIYKERVCDRSKGFVALYITIAISMALSLLVFSILHASDRVQELYSQFRKSEALRNSILFCKYKIDDILMKNPDFNFDQTRRGVLTRANQVVVDTPLDTKCSFTGFDSGHIRNGCKDVRVTIMAASSGVTLERVVGVHVCDHV